MQDVKRLHPAFRDSQTTAQKRKWLTADATAPQCGLDSKRSLRGHSSSLKPSHPRDCSEAPAALGECTTAESPPTSSQGSSSVRLRRAWAPDQSFGLSAPQFRRNENAPSVRHYRLQTTHLYRVQITTYLSVSCL